MADRQIAFGTTWNKPTVNTICVYHGQSARIVEVRYHDTHAVEVTVELLDRARRSCAPYNLRTVDGILQ